VGDFLLCFCFVSGVGLGDWVGEIFLWPGEAVGDGLDVTFFFRCFRVGAGVGVAKIFLIFVPNDSSAVHGSVNAPHDMTTITDTHTIVL
jgi:hypothetical protein